MPADSLSPAARSWNMSRIKGRDTGPELAVRRWLHRAGYRFRLCRADLPGRPDIVFPGRRRVIFVHGCFWHRHPGCRHAYLPKSRVAFWQAKFDGTVARDQAACQALQAGGWAVLVIWECDINREQALPALLQDFLGPPGSGMRTAVPADQCKMEGLQT